MSNLETKVQQLIEQQAATNKQVEALAKAMTAIVRMEEANNNIIEKLNGFGRRISESEKEIQKIAVQVALNGQQTSIMGRWRERMIWFIVAAAAASFNLFKPGG